MMTQEQEEEKLNAKLRSMSFVCIECKEKKNGLQSGSQKRAEQPSQAEPSHINQADLIPSPSKKEQAYFKAQAQAKENPLSRANKDEIKAHNEFIGYKPSQAKPSIEETLYLIRLFRKYNISQKDREEIREIISNEVLRNEVLK